MAETQDESYNILEPLIVSVVEELHEPTANEQRWQIIRRYLIRAYEMGRARQVDSEWKLINDCLKKFLSNKQSGEKLTVDDIFEINRILNTHHDRNS